MQIPLVHPAHRACMVLAAVYGFGTDISVLVEVSGQTEIFVRTLLRRARKTRMLTGQTLRVGWNDKKTGQLALLLDAMTGISDLYRPPDEKRSAAAKTRMKPVSRKQPAPRQVVLPGAVFTPKIVNSDPLYDLAERERGRG